MGVDGDDRPLADGERVLLVDAKQRRYLLTLRAGAQFHTHAGILDHDDMIGTARRRLGHRQHRATLPGPAPDAGRLVLKMPRGAQVIYPKDLAAILMEADIAPGRAGARSRRGLGSSVHGPPPGRRLGRRATSCGRTSPTGPGPTWRRRSGRRLRYRVELRDVYAGIDERGLDRIVLDLPEPWRVLPHVRGALRPGGILCSYLPTINQTAELRRCLDEVRLRLGAARSRSCTAPGTSSSARCGPTTGWSATPAS